MVGVGGVIVSTHLSRREGVTEEGSLPVEEVSIPEAEVRVGWVGMFTTISAVKLGYLVGGIPS